VIASPILGPEGNREFLVHLRGGPEAAGDAERADHLAERIGAATMSVEA
jgi:hypothetical protein